jgi:small ligand-binding sensory domain FIST
VGFASALSEHPVTVTAIGEVAGQVLEALGQAPDLAALFVTPHHAGALDDAAGAVRAILEPGVLIGCGAVGVVGNAREVEGGPGVVLWAAKLGIPVRPLRLRAVRSDDGTTITGWPVHPAFVPTAAIVIADPFSFAVDSLFEHVAAHGAHVPIVGGNASVARGPGGNRLTLDGEVMTDGAVGALLGAPVSVSSVVSQGCRPIGRPYTVTRAEQNTVIELGGAPALERLSEITTAMTDDERALLHNGVYLGIVVNAHAVDYGRGDFLIRDIVEVDRLSGAVTVTDVVDVGVTAQFHLRDADAADEDLRALLADRRAAGALVFTCNGRGVGFFGDPDHDAAVVAEALADPATAGFFAAGEFGPIGGRNFMHGYTASIALLAHPPG